MDDVDGGRATCEVVRDRDLRTVHRELSRYQRVAGKCAADSQVSIHGRNHHVAIGVASLVEREAQVRRETSRRVDRHGSAGADRPATAERGICRAQGDRLAVNRAHDVDIGQAQIAVWIDNLRSVGREHASNHRLRDAAGDGSVDFESPGKLCTPIREEAVGKCERGRTVEGYRKTAA